jgi:hypothetical protein
VIGYVVESAIGWRAATRRRMEEFTGDTGTLAEGTRKAGRGTETERKATGK